METSLTKRIERNWLIPLLALAALIVLVAACGAAPTPTPQPTPTPAPPTATLTAEERKATVSFAKHIVPLFQKHCTRCHSGANPPSGLSLDSYAAVQKGNNYGPIMRYSNPNASLLYQVLPQGKMPKGADKLSDEDMQMLAAWIYMGAPDN